MRSLSALFARLCAGVLLISCACGQAVGGPDCSFNCKYPAKTIDGKKLDLDAASDKILTDWKSRALYYLIMGVTNGPKGASEDDFAKADVDSLVGVLCRKGFLPLPGSNFQSKLVGKDATLQNLDTEITKSLPKIPAFKRPLLVFYYSGHGMVNEDSQTLELWAGDAETLEEKYSFSLQDEIRKIRLVYGGDLLIILDTCYSGQAINELVHKKYRSITGVLASSTDNKPSLAIKIPPNEKGQLTSPFTYSLTQVLRGSEPCDSGTADESPLCKAARGGVLDMSGLLAAVMVGLQKLNLPRPVVPTYQPFETVQGGMVGYYCEAVRDLNDSLRKVEAGAREIPDALNSAPSVAASDQQALGIVDENNDLLATVTAHVYGGAVSGVTVDWLLSGNLNKAPTPKTTLSIVSFDLPTRGNPKFQKVLDLSASSSQPVLESLKAQASRADQDAISAGFLSIGLTAIRPRYFQGVPGPVISDSVGDARTFLSKDASGKVVFGKSSMSDLEGIFANQDTIKKK